jgi:hypothetical protein
MISSTVVRSLYTGMTTESNGLAGSGAGRAVGIDAETVPQPAVVASGSHHPLKLRWSTVAVAEMVSRTNRDW